jgi:ABC-type transport system involved in multi-copper enzyme maturation permease subunit
MPAVLNWLLRLLPTNPICMRLVQGGSRRMRHLYIRSGYLAVMIVVLLFVILGEVTQGAASFRSLAAAGATTFLGVSYLQLGLICLLTPIFMAGAIAQEANPATWDILLTTPLNSLQVVLGNLFGRLFFVLALLFSTLPLFMVTQYFGGVPGEAIFASYAIAGFSSLVVASIAVTLSVTRTAGRRAVFIFYIAVVTYIAVTYAIDVPLREPIAPGAAASYTTWMTPVNPFLAMRVLLSSNLYVPHLTAGTESLWIEKIWLGRPIMAFCLQCALTSLVLIAFSTIRLRVIGASVGKTPWYRKMFGLSAKGASERPPRRVGANPIAWRESTARGGSLAAMFGRWGFVAAGLLATIVSLTLYHTGAFTSADLRLAIGTILLAEVLIVVLTALNQSATAVSREREDGTLDIILTTPIQPGPYLYGKLRGLITYLLPMLLAPTLTMLMVAAYVLADGFGREGGIMVTDVVGTANVQVPVVLPVGAIALPLVMFAFVAFCVMVGLQWSIKTRGTIGSVIAAVGVVIVVAGVIGLCGMSTRGLTFGQFGAVTNALGPVNLVLAIVYPAMMMEGAMMNRFAASISMIIGALVAAGAYGMIVYGMHSNMKRTFMMTVRKLAGVN